MNWACATRATACAGEVIGFLSDYDNILGECTSSSGTDCTVGDAFNGDAATVAGVEALLSVNLTSGPYFQHASVVCLHLYRR